MVPWLTSSGSAIAEEDVDYTQTSQVGWGPIPWAQLLNEDTLLPV